MLFKIHGKALQILPILSRFCHSLWKARRGCCSTVRALFDFTLMLGHLNTGNGNIEYLTALIRLRLTTTQRASTATARSDLVSDGMIWYEHHFQRCPLVACCPPLERSLLGRVVWLFRLCPSLDGGLLLFWLFWLSCSSSFWMRSSNRSTAAINARMSSAACSGLVRQSSINSSRVRDAIFMNTRYKVFL